MTEIKKMMAGLPYDCADTDIRALHMKGKRMMWEFNSIPPDDIVSQRDILC